MDDPSWVKGWSRAILAFDAVRRSDFAPVPGLVRDAWDTRTDAGWAPRVFMLGPLVHLSAFTGDEAPMLEARARLEEWAINWGAPYRIFAWLIVRNVGGIEETEPPTHPISVDIRPKLLEHAVELARSALRDPEDLETRWNTLGLALYCAGDYDGAVDAMQKEYELRGEGNAINWLCLALAEHARGHEDVALDWYARAIDWMAANENTEQQQWYRAEAARILGL